MSETVLEDPFATVPGDAEAARQGRSSMKLVSCVIRPESLEAVTAALSQLEVLGGMTLTDVRGFGRQKGQVEHYRGGEYTIRFLPKVKVEIAVHAKDAEDVITAIGRAARTGQVGDGKVFVSDVHHAMRIRTGERGPSAL